MVQSLKSGEPRELVSGGGSRYLPTGHIVYTAGNNLLAVPFDPDKLETTGGQVPVVEGIDMTFALAYALSDSGTLVYIPGSSTAAAAQQRTLVWVDRKGKEEPIGAEANGYSLAKISPDGTKVALSVTAG
jgi:hypothetical protein